MRASLGELTTSKTIRLCDLKYGDLAVVAEGIYKGEIVYRDQSAVALLCDRSVFWAGPEKMGPEIRLLAIGDTITFH